MVATATQLPTASSGTLSLILENTTDSSSLHDSSQHPVEYLQGELVSLRLQHAEMQKRIQYLRHALVALVHVFGPEVLVTPAHESKLHSRDLSRRPAKIIDLSRKVLSRSAGWCTFDQVLEAIRDECPSALAIFINPGAAVSNALRTLHRHDELEFSLNDGQGRLRWTANKEVPAESPKNLVP